MMKHMLSVLFGWDFDYFVQHEYATLVFKSHGVPVRVGFGSCFALVRKHTSSF